MGWRRSQDGIWTIREERTGVGGAKIELDLNGFGHRKLSKRLATFARELIAGGGDNQGWWPQLATC